MTSSRRANLPVPEKPVNIKDIARELGVSTGTVDRALHAKPGINPMTRARVLRTAESLGYRPNLAARYLKSRRALRISVHLPREIALFWDSLREGIREAATLFEPTLQVEFRSYPRLGEGDVPLFEETLEEGTNGLIIAPGDPTALKPWIRRAAKRSVPVACVVTDAPGTQRLTSVSADPFTVGAVAGELVCRYLPGGGPVAFFTGWLGTEDHAEKLRGFEASLEKTGRGIQLAAVVEAHDDEREGHRRTLNLLDAHPGLKGIYVSTVNSLPVLRAVEHAGFTDKLTIVTTDLFPELVERIRAGRVAATVYQRPLSQGRLALQALYQFLVDGTCPPTKIKVVPHLVMRSNLDLFLERLRVDSEALDQRTSVGPAPGVRRRRRAARASRPRINV
ncbi:MAG: substrate-binding domain-containing protein [Luteitalea sp.]|nr:substrate-binding domain-containing protein [Luteitalea sp.]